MIGRCKPAALWLSISLAGQVCLGGQLDDFERRAGSSSGGSSGDGPHSSPSTASRHRSHIASSDEDHDSFLGQMLVWFVTLPFHYREDFDGEALSDESVEGDWTTEEGGLNYRHHPGSPVLPYVRGEYNLQYIDSDLDAQDIRMEAGYKLLAFHGRHTRYTERSPDDDLTINQYYGVIRIGGSYPKGARPIHGWELGLGLGGVQQIGNDEHSSAAICIPFRIYPAEWVGFEFRPAWYEPQERVISDYDLSASLGWRFVQLRGGYRWLWMQGAGHFFNGPYAGVSVSF